MKVLPEDVNLSSLIEDIRRLFGASAPAGYLEGRTAIRDAVVSELECSELEAEQIVDTMVSRGFLKYRGRTSEGIDDLRAWEFTSDVSMSAVS